MIERKTNAICALSKIGGIPSLTPPSLEQESILAKLASVFYPMYLFSLVPDLPMNAEQGAGFAGTTFCEKGHLPQRQV